MDRINSDSEESSSSEDSEDEIARAPKTGTVTKGLLGMEFMKRGIERDKQKYLDLKEQLRAESEEATKRTLNAIETGVACEWTKWVWFDVVGSSQLPVDGAPEIKEKTLKGKIAFHGELRIH